MKLALQLSNHDKEYVDSYYGPTEWLTEVKSNSISLEQIIIQSKDFLEILHEIKNKISNNEQNRILYIEKNLLALKTRAETLQGKKFSFDDQTRFMYDVQIPPIDEREIFQLSHAFNDILEGDGPVNQRIENFNKQFLIPKENYEKTIQTAISETRKRTKDHLELPSSENFLLELVSDQPWGAFNSYQGSFQSLIQVNTDIYACALTS